MLRWLLPPTRTPRPGAVVKPSNFHRRLGMTRCEREQVGASWCQSCYSGRQLELERAERALCEPQRQPPRQSERQPWLPLCELRRTLDDAFRNRPASCLPSVLGGKKNMTTGVLVAIGRNLGERSPVGCLVQDVSHEFCRSKLLIESFDSLTLSLSHGEREPITVRVEV